MKVTLSLTRKSANGEQSEIGDMSFIHGLASTGLTPFEQRLEGLGPGGTMEYDLDIATAQHFFAHLWLEIYQMLGFQLPQVVIPVIFEIKKVGQPDASEVVRQLARIGGHGGCGGSCGCGCG